MYITAMILLIFFAAIGIAAFITQLIDMIAQSDDENEYLLIIPALSADNAEQKLRSAVSRISASCRCEILCLCEKNDRETEAIITKMKQTAPYLLSVTKEELKEKLGL